jgi:FkbM family methyltransferase
VLKWIQEGVAWRYRRAARSASRKRYLRRTFRNAEALIRNYAEGAPCDEAVGRDGVVVRHPPGRTALALMIIEVWCDEIYTRNFYRPSPDDVVIDAGANVGLFSLWMARTCPSCRVFAFEPFAENYRFLAANLEHAGAHGVTPVLGAVAGQTGEADIVDGGARSQDHRLTAPGPDASAHVRTYGLADILSLSGAATIALFKCDIEGSEHDLFEHAASDDLRRVSKFAIEYHDNLRPGTLALLQARLRHTHRLVMDPTDTSGYGMLYATREDIPE